jgi:hypothetical protein
MAVAHPTPANSVHRPALPPGSPTRLAGLAADCWHPAAEMRPSFGEVGPAAPARAHPFNFAPSVVTPLSFLRFRNCSCHCLLSPSHLRGILHASIRDIPARPS